jgi:hypothetical protein
MARNAAIGWHGQITKEGSIKGIVALAFGVAALSGGLLYNIEATSGTTGTAERMVWTAATDVGPTTDLGAPRGGDLGVVIVGGAVDEALDAPRGWDLGVVIRGGGVDEALDAPRGREYDMLGVPVGTEATPMTMPEYATVLIDAQDVGDLGAPRGADYGILMVTQGDEVLEAMNAPRGPFNHDFE